MENGKLFNLDPAWLKRTDDDNIFLIQSGSDPDVWYRVADGKCDCLGFEHRGDCRHIKMLRREGVLNSNDIGISEMMKPWEEITVDDLDRCDQIAFATSRYHTKSLGDGRVVPVRTSLGSPKFPLGYTIDAAIHSVMPDRWMLKLGSNQEYLEAYRKKLDDLGIERFERDLALIRVRCGNRLPVLLCYENIQKGEKFCHRRILADWFFEETGRIAPELTDI